MNCVCELFDDDSCVIMIICSYSGCTAACFLIILLAVYVAMYAYRDQVSMTTQR